MRCKLHYGESDTLNVKELKEMITCEIEELNQFGRNDFNRLLVIEGPRGIGKESVVKQVVDEYNSKVSTNNDKKIFLSVDCDVNHYNFWQSELNRVRSYENGGVIFFNDLLYTEDWRDISRVARSYAEEFANGLQFGNNWLAVASSTGPEEPRVKENMTKLSPSDWSRMNLVRFCPDFEEWEQYLMDNDKYDRQLLDLVFAFIKEKPLDGDDSRWNNIDPEISCYTLITSDRWEDGIRELSHSLQDDKISLSEALKKNQDEKKYFIRLGGLLGKTLTDEFEQFVKEKLM